MVEKINVELTHEEIEILINKVAEHDNVTAALQVRDGEERLAIINRLNKYTKTEEKTK